LLITAHDHLLAVPTVAPLLHSVVMNPRTHPPGLPTMGEAYVTTE